MIRRLKKLLVLSVKLAVTAGVLWWVLSGVRWHDYVVTPDGETRQVLDARGDRVLVAADGGPQWQPAGRFRDVEGQVVRPGMPSVLRRVRWPFYALAAGILAMQLTLMGIRWWYLLRFQRIGVGLAVAIRLMFVGHFFNFFLPGSTGGDVLRAYLITRRTKDRTVAVATVLLDRFVGLAGMAALAGAMTLATWQSPQAQQAAAAVGIILLIIVAAGLVLFSRTVGRLLRLDWLIDRLPKSAHFRLAIRSLQALPRSPRAVAAVAVMTVSVHVLLAGAIASLGEALSLPVDVHLYFLFVPVIYILAAVPVSIGGLGVVEGMYIVFFAQSAGAERSPILALALLARLTPMLLSLPGLVFWLVERAPRPASPAPADETPPPPRATDGARSPGEGP